MTWRVGTKINFVGKYMVFLKNCSWMKLIYEYYMNIGLFGANFNLILDKKGFFRESILRILCHYFLVVGRYNFSKVDFLLSDSSERLATTR